MHEALTVKQTEDFEKIYRVYKKKVIQIWHVQCALIIGCMNVIFV